jgi:hypothetical protein
VAVSVATRESTVLVVAAVSPDPQETVMALLLPVTEKLPELCADAEAV